MDIFKKISRMNPYSRLAEDGLISDVQYHIDTGSYMFNGLLSGSLFKGFPGNRIVGLAGPQAAGKTLLSLIVLKSFLEKEPTNRIIYFDTEGAIETDMLLTMDMDLKRFQHVPVKTLEEFKNQIIQIIDIIRKEKSTFDEEKKELLKSGNEEAKDMKFDSFFFVLDSLGMMVSKKEIDDSLKDKSISDMGLRAKLIKSTFRSITMDLAILAMPMIVTSHVYDSMSQYMPKGISGGKGLLYSASIIIELVPSKDKVDTTVSGTIMRATTRKSRVTKQYKSVKMKLDFDHGLDRYYGLLTFAVDKKIVKKEGKKYVFPDGEKYFEKNINENPSKIWTEELLKVVDVEINKEFSYGNPMGEENIEIETVSEVEEVKEVKEFLTIGEATIKFEESPEQETEEELLDEVLRDKRDNVEVESEEPKSDDIDDVLDKELDKQKHD